jgi:DNA-binding PadR family transcriptional regulator
VYTTLTRLEDKGYVRTRIGASTPTRGGRRKKLYVVEPAGRDAVRATMSALRSMSRGLKPVLGLP